eukprot:scaffold8755_cov145-Cylindrotheca_fusiformis.AAC.3
MMVEQLERKKYRSPNIFTNSESREGYIDTHWTDVLDSDDGQVLLDRGVIPRGQPVQVRKHALLDVKCRSIRHVQEFATTYAPFQRMSLQAIYRSSSTYIHVI